MSQGEACQVALWQSQVVRGRGARRPATGVGGLHGCGSDPLDGKEGFCG
jgi:hypothetical protein